MDRTVERRSAFILAALILIMILVTGVSIVSLQRVVDQKDDLAFKHAQRLIDIGNLQMAAEQKVSHSRGYILTGQDELREKIGAARAKFNSTLQNLKATVTTKLAQDQLARIEADEARHH